MQWRLVEQLAAETATGFKKEKAHTPMGKPNWLRTDNQHGNSEASEYPPDFSGLQNRRRS
jgi:hypothetical protein